ncbi:CDGSH iron-sulfur domain-containing protein [[Mycobacterium] holstebronense]|uniref:CDGSH iron-sulfur domain-containing protein n=1 Tax=[Mycobacterium] holstebronense TaxID=3064288 RepID=A0ABN9NK59_9MYCO|nr:CDGSH iron-sulfur domain-containing protein [Mycolicibacter sp. MU0102]CAJ1507838.1 CDGSH iron-sulfur domain-containing protein [Mycolicibacter sp. MU0102]
MTTPEKRVVQPVRNGPVLIAGPVRIETPEGVVESDRFMVAVCACGRSRNYPLCDTSHRCRKTSRRRTDADGVKAE